MIVDKSGSLSGVKRHDYLPFGEEISAGIGSRAAGQGYTGDSTRQHFTGYEMDGESGLNFAQARYQSSTQGRFTSVDPMGASANAANPQSFNRYSYVQNSPTNATDPSGMMMYDASMGWGDVAGMWQGGGDDGSHFGAFETGQSIVADAEARFDQGVADTIFANHLNDLIRKGKLTRAQAAAAIEGNDTLAVEDVDVTAEITGLAQEAGVEGVRSETVLDVPGDLTMDYWIQNHYVYGDGGCAQFPQILAEQQGIAMGLAGGGRFRAGPGVMGNKKMKRGTVIASGWVDGYYPNYTETGSHVAIFLRFVEGGFDVLEQSRWRGEKTAHVRTHRITHDSGDYYNNPNAYRIVEVGPPVRGIPNSRGARP